MNPKKLTIPRKMTTMRMKSPQFLKRLLQVEEMDSWLPSHRQELQNCTPWSKAEFQLIPMLILRIIKCTATNQLCRTPRTSPTLNSVHFIMCLTHNNAQSMAGHTLNNLTSDRHLCHNPTADHRLCHNNHTADHHSFRNNRTADLHLSCHNRTAGRHSLNSHNNTTRTEDQGRLSPSLLQCLEMVRDTDNNNPHSESRTPTKWCQYPSDPTLGTADTTDTRDHTTRRQLHSTCKSLSSSSN